LHDLPQSAGLGTEAGRALRKNAKKQAVVAVACKLAVLLHMLWVSGEVNELLTGLLMEGLGRSTRQFSVNGNVGTVGIAR
jgi:hypothetical protein